MATSSIPRATECEAYAVAVIGGGPAGSAAAIVCASAGLPVAMIVRRQAGRAVPCESLHPGIVPLLMRLGANALEGAIRGRFGAIVSDGRRTPFGSDENGAWQGFHVDRARFDDALLRHARTLGVTVLENERAASIEIGADRRVAAVGLASGKQLKARWTVDASGQRQWLSHALGNRIKTLSEQLTATRGEVEAASAFETSDAQFCSLADGWTWVAPLDGRRAVWTRLCRRGARPTALPSALSAARTVLPPVGRDVTWRMARPVAGAGYVVVGEAGVSLDPSFGQGVIAAILSGMAGAQTILEAERRPARAALALARFDDWCVQQAERAVSQLRTPSSTAALLPLA